MRVITGLARGRKLKEPAGRDIRPTTDKVKESVFNIIQFDIEGRRVLDLFAGTGQLGIEALSRGAASAVFVDQSGDAVKLVRENLRATGLEKYAEVVQGDSLKILERGEGFDLIFLDPPYDSPLLEKALKAIQAFDILREGGIMVCESMPEKRLPDLDAPYFKGREYRYGKIKISIYGRENGESGRDHEDCDLSGQL